MFLQIGVCDARGSGNMYGMVVGTQPSTTGIMDYGYLAQSVAGTSISNPFAFSTENGLRWGIDQRAQMIMYPMDLTGAQLFTMRNGGGSFQLVNTAGSTTFLSVDQAGIILLNGTQVLESRRTGWNGPTGSLARGTFDSGATLATTAQTLAALITDLRAHGLIGT